MSFARCASVPPTVQVEVIAEIHPAPFFEMLKNKMNMGLSGHGHRMGWPWHEAAADAGDSVSAV